MIGSAHNRKRRDTGMEEKENKLPVFGIGPIYVISCFVLTAIGVGLDYYNIFDSGEMGAMKLVAVILGVSFVIEGIFLWGYAVLIQKIVREVKEGKLVTDGAYAIVRNPIYSAFTLVFTGFICICSNWYLLGLPIVFWGFLTILLKRTEEKWLKETFGDEYIEYCTKVNRIIPWFKRP